jgi:hypothetical protein
LSHRHQLKYRDRGGQSQDVFIRAMPSSSCTTKPISPADLSYQSKSRSVPVVLVTLKTAMVPQLRPQCRPRMSGRQHSSGLTADEDIKSFSRWSETKRPGGSSTTLHSGGLWNPNRSPAKTPGHVVRGSTSPHISQSPFIPSLLSALYVDARLEFQDCLRNRHQFYHCASTTYTCD